MFQTHKSAEIPIPIELSNNEFRVWSYVQYKLNMYWLQVAYIYIDEHGDEQSNTIFVTELEHLLQLNNESDITLYDIYLISPNHLHGGKGWKMETLKEIHIGYEPDAEYEQEAHIFVLDNKNRYVHSYMDSTEDELTKKKVIFETINHSAS